MSFTRADYPPLSTIGYLSTISAGATFSPSSITGCQLWLDGADATTITLTGANITTWSDKSGSANHMNTLAPSSGTGLWPTVGTSINGLSTVKFLSQTGINQSTTLNNVKNLFWVGRIAAPDSGTGGQLYFLLGHDSSYEWCGDSYGSTFMNTSYAQSGIYNASPTSLFTSDARATTNATFSSVYFPTSPNVSLLSVAGITGSTAYQGLCYDRTAHNGWCGDLAEVIIYSTALTLSQRQQVEGYLAWKWGLQASLPGGHPYASTNPNAGFASTLTSTILLNLTGYVQSGANYVLKPQIPLATFGYYTGFNPISLSTLALWIDGADPLGTGVAPAQGTLLSSFKDKSGNNTPISTFSTTVGFPIYKTAANGALGTIQLAAGNGLLISSIAMTPYMSLYAVYSPINPSTGVSIEQGTNALANAGFLLTSVSTTSTIYAISISKFPIFTGATSNYTYGGYKFYYYTTVGNTAATITNSEGTNINAFILAGGGGGGGFVGSGGGAGGLLSTVGAFSGSYTITVGGGGTAGASSGIAPNGGNSVFNSLTAIGGGGGGAAFSSGATGGCGGGAGFNNSPGSGTTGQGYGGGTNNPGGAGAGGGGIGSAGSNTLGLQTANEIGANGGFGYGGTAVSIFLDGLQYGGGGGGGGSGNTGANIAGGIAYSGGGNGGRGFNDGTAIGSNATNGKGGGGGGGGNYNGGGSQPAGGTGGSGVVILYHTL